MVGGWVDRTFFHIRHSHARALRRFRVAIARPRSREELARFVRRFVSRMLAPKSASTVVRFGDETFTAGRIDDAIVRRAVELFEGRPKWRGGVLAAPGATGLPEVEASDFSADLSRAGILLVQPLAAYGELHGLVLLGEKQSERRYIEEDLALLSGVAEAASEALEHLNLAQRVAEHRILQERLDAINRMKSDFLSRVAHDLRTPVTSIDWSSRNLLDGLAGPMNESQRTYLQAILTSAVHLDRLVTNLLEISRLEDGAATVEPEPVLLAPVAEEAMASLLPIAAGKNVRFLRRLGSRLDPVRANREKLVQVLVNLLVNAIRYAPRGSEVEVQLACCGGGRQMLAVRDAGPGIAPGDEERIFQRFQQGAPSPHAEPQGFGLGLFVVRAYVEAFSGSVHAANRPGGGAEFVVLLPEWFEGGTATA
jgi:signal transduction histidine kinase